MIRISIIVCCYNSASRLQQTLKHLAKLGTEAVNCELIIVDNNSTDNTKDLSLTIWNNLKNRYPLKVVEERNPGLSHARKAGVKSATGEIIVFCDDDNWLNPNYLNNVVEIFNKMPEVGIIGGTGIEIIEHKQPRWFNQIKGRYAVGTSLESSQYVSNVYGAGMAIRKAILNKIETSLFNSQLHGRKGKSLSGGEDTEICFAAAILGYKIYWSIENTFFHFIPQSRLTYSYLIRLFKGSAHTHANINGLRYLATGEKSALLKSILVSDVKWLLKLPKSVLFKGQLHWHLLWLLHKIEYWRIVVLNYRNIKKSYAHNYWFNDQQNKENH